MSRLTQQLEPESRSGRRNISATKDSIKQIKSRKKYDLFQLLWTHEDMEDVPGLGSDPNYVDGLYDITDHVLSIRHDTMLQRPWDHFTASLVFQHGMSNPRCPRIGGWIIMKSKGAKSKDDKSKTATFFGFIKDVTSIGSIDDRGVTDSFTVNITAVSWLEALSMNQVVLALTARGSVGTFFAATPDQFFSGTQKVIRSKWWDSFIDSVLAAVDPQNPTALGVSLSKMWSVLGAMRLPPQLIPGSTIGNRVLGTRLSDEINVVYDDITRAKYAPRLTIDPVPGWGIDGIKSIIPTGQSTIDILMGTFQADLNLVELYPALEPYDDSVRTSLDDQIVFDPELEIASQAAFDTVQEEGISISGDESVAVGDVQVITFSEEETELSPSKEEVQFALAEVPLLVEGEPASRLASLLGVNPILVYRIKPFRTQSMYDYQRNPYTPVNLVISGTNRSDYRADFARIYKGLFDTITWHRKNKDKIIHGFTYSADEISGWTGNFTESDHINSVSINLPNQADSAVQWLYQVGLPIQHQDSIRYFGLRHISPRWPFFPPMDADMDEDSPEFSADLLSGLYTIALLAAQFLLSGGRFLRGTIKMSKFSPELRPGMTVEVDISRFVAPFNGKSQTILTAYIDTVNHQIMDNNGTTHGMTTIGYSRGLVEESYRTRQVRVPAA